MEILHLRYTAFFNVCVTCNYLFTNLLHFKMFVVQQFDVDVFRCATEIKFTLTYLS